MVASQEESAKIFGGRRHVSPLGTSHRRNSLKNFYFDTLLIIHTRNVVRVDSSQQLHHTQIQDTVPSLYKEFTRSISCSIDIVLGCHFTWYMITPTEKRSHL